MTAIRINLLPVCQAPQNEYAFLGIAGKQSDHILVVEAEKKEVVTQQNITGT
jgi:hypothetical protein